VAIGEVIKLAFEILFKKQYQIRFVRTIVGWFNVYLVDHPEQLRVTLSPDQFEALFPGVSNKAKYGCNQIDYDEVVKLFGEDVLLYTKEAEIA
jgi:hypothetical protein